MRTLTEDILARAVEDWVTPFEVVSVCIRRGLRDRDDVRDLALGLIIRMIATGLLVPGDIGGSKHRPWECSPSEAVARIAAEWASFPDLASLGTGDIAWLDATPEGNVSGRRFCFVNIPPG
ncbi:hypothetical protein WBN73_02810 [Paenarthrobacter sp. CCNWLY172]